MAKPEQWRKKSVVIEAIQWTGGNAVTLLDWIKPEARQEGAVIVIPTLEGDHEASLGDWIIKGVAGEFYPCKPDIFTMTYERASPTVKVKPLVWTQVASSVYDAPAGGYRIFHHGPDGAVGSCNIHGPTAFFAMRSNLEAAKAAAQADYEARIRSQVDVTPAPTMAEAAKVLADAIDRMTNAEYLDAAYELDKALQTHDRGKAASALRRIAEARHD